MTSLSDKAGLLITANLIKYAVGFMLPMVVVRMLSQSDYGTYQQLILVGEATAGLMIFGLPTSVYYFYNNVAAERRPALIAQTSLMLLLSGALASLAVFGGATVIAASLDNPSMAGLLSIYAVSIAFIIASEHSIAFMIAQDRYVLAICFETGEIIVRVALLLAPLLFGYGIDGLVAGIVIYSVLRFLLRSMSLFTRGRMQFSGWSKHMFPLEQLRYSVPLALVSLTVLVGNTFNKGFIAASFSPIDYAIFAVGNFSIPFAAIFQTSVANVLRATLPRLVQEEKLAEIVEILRESARKLSIIALPLFIFLYGYASEVINLLFTAKYAQSVPIFQIFLLELPLEMLMLSPVPQAFGRTKLNLYIILSSTALLLLLSFVLIKTFGLQGGALAYIATQYFQSLAFLVVVLRLTKTTLLDLLPLPTIARVLFAALIGLLTSRFVPTTSLPALLNLLLVGVTFGVTFIIVAAVTGVFTRDDRQLIGRWLAKILPDGSL